ncbi:hypothetical protein E2C01_016530 [Portunus trituberculatus]|uniref:Uncharacterized protein n=1 Tax=Portunus trituberculatus TaxID=210409 RepID=A0A5B7DPM7_PORTR|nr:hypothetical protein [Portunus trituberculatus]
MGRPAGRPRALGRPDTNQTGPRERLATHPLGESLPTPAPPPTLLTGTATCTRQAPLCSLPPSTRPATHSPPGQPLRRFAF